MHNHQRARFLGLWFSIIHWTTCPLSWGNVRIVFFPWVICHERTWDASSCHELFVMRVRWMRRLAMSYCLVSTWNAAMRRLAMSHVSWEYLGCVVLPWVMYHERTWDASSWKGPTTATALGSFGSKIKIHLVIFKGLGSMCALYN